MYMFNSETETICFKESPIIGTLIVMQYCCVYHWQFWCGGGRGPREGGKTIFGTPYDEQN